MGPGAVNRWASVSVSKQVRNLWTTETRIGSLHFQDGCRGRRLNLALVFKFIFVLCISFDWWMCAFVVLCLVFSIPSQEIGLDNVSKMTYFVSRLKWDIKPQSSMCAFDTDSGVRCSPATPVVVLLCMCKCLIGWCSEAVNTHMVHCEVEYITPLCYPVVVLIHVCVHPMWVPGL